MSQHRAYIHKTPGQNGAIESIDTPAPAANQVQIKVTHTAINPVDWKIRSGGFPLGKFPHILGSDASGVISKIGSDVKEDLNEGDRVFWQGVLGDSPRCTFQEYALIEANLVAKSPKNAKDEELSGVMLAAIAAVVGLYDKTGELQITPPPWANGGDKAGQGKAALVLGGSSSVGQYVIQLLRLSGFTQIFTTASSSHEAFLKKLGAHHILSRDASAKDFVSKLDKGVTLKAVYDAIGTDETRKLGTDVLEAQDGGHFVTAMPPSLKEDKGKITMRGIMGLSANPQLQETCLPFIKAVSGEDGWIAKGSFTPNRVKVLKGLDKIEEAMEMNKKGLSGEKVVVEIN